MQRKIGVKSRSQQEAAEIDGPQSTSPTFLKLSGDFFFSSFISFRGIEISPWSLFGKWTD